MAYLLDTHLLLWSLYRLHLLPRQAMMKLEPVTVPAFFSVVSLVQIGIKQKTGKLEFDLDLLELRQELLRNRYTELPITSAHAIALSVLPRVHKDPFDCLLVAQAVAESLVLLTVDGRLGVYGHAVEVLR